MGRPWDPHCSAQGVAVWPGPLCSVVGVPGGGVPTGLALCVAVCRDHQPVPWGVATPAHGTLSPPQLGQAPAGLRGDSGCPTCPQCGGKGTSSEASCHRGRAHASTVGPSGWAGHWSPPDQQVPSRPPSPRHALFRGTYRSPQACPNSGQVRPGSPGAWRGVPPLGPRSSALSRGRGLAFSPGGHGEGPAEPGEQDAGPRLPAGPSAGHRAFSCPIGLPPPAAVQFTADLEALGSGALEGQPSRPQPQGRAVRPAPAP